MDWDMTWKKPTPPQEKALEIIIQQKPRDLTEFEAAEFIFMANESLWYIQAQSWAKQPPKIGKSAQIWQRACQAIVDIVDLGYDKSQQMWWPMTSVENPTAITLLLMDFGYMLKQYRQQSPDVVSRGFEVFLDIVCGPNWEKRYKIFIKKAMGSALKK